MYHGVCARATLQQTASVLHVHILTLLITSAGTAITAVLEQSSFAVFDDKTQVLRYVQYIYS